MSLRPSRNRLRIAALTFLCGLALNGALKPAPPGGLPATLEEMVPPPPTPALVAPPQPAWAEVARVASPAREAPEYSANGLPLELDYDALDAQLISEAKILPLPSGRVLAAAGNTIYMLAGAGPGQVVWRHSEAQPIFDFEYVAATGLVYVTAGDNNLLILDGWTGRERHRESRNGRGGFGRTVAYGQDLCLVTDDNSGYRSAEDFIPPMSDGVTAWRGTKMLWHRELPPDAELRVSGDRIFAVTRTAARVLVTEVHPPARAR